MTMLEGLPATLSKSLSRLEIGTAGAGAEVWLADLSSFLDGTPPDFSAWLDSEEQARCARYRKPEDAIRFAATRVLLKHLLAHSRQLSRQLSPETVRLVADARGKPCWPGGGGHFNVSHSGRFACLAWSATHRVGIDIERIVSADVDDLAALALSARECAILAQVPVQDRQALFYRWWVCKEAVLKANGLGIGEDLRSFSVDHVDTEPVLLLPEHPAMGIKASRFSSIRVSLLPAPEGYMAALAVEHA